MKKLLGVFVRAPASESPRSATTGGADAQTKRWGGFLLPLATPQPVIPANHEVLRELDAVVRGIASRVKAALAKMLNGEEFELELRDFKDFVEQALAKLQQQSSEPMPELLKGYFSSSVGIAGCEQTAFPSLMLDFVAKMRVYAMKEELNIKMQQREGRRSGEGNEDASTTAWTEVSSEWTTAPESFDSFVPLLEFVMACVIAIASSETLMDKFRCELPNIIALTAEEYPSVAMFIRDQCNRALLCVPDRSFNAGLAWYLLDCNAITKTVELMTSYALATTTTPDNAERALQAYLSSTPDRSIQGNSEAGIDNSAAEAAVSEALGLTRCDREASPTSSPSLPSEEDLRGGPQSSSETFCLPGYAVRVGLRAVVYVLEKTYRFTLVLLEEFHTSGGYALLLRLLDTCTEEEIPTFLDILTLLIPLGSRSSESSESAERMTSGSILGARNANAFAAMRDLLLNCITGSIEDAEMATELDAEAQRRNEHLILQLLTHVLHIYTSDYDNFVFLEPKTRTLALLLTKLPYTSFYDAQVIILRIVEYVCCAAKRDDSLPHEILSIVCGLLIAYSPLSFQATSSDAGTNSEESSAILSPQKLQNAYKEGPRATLSALMCECLVKILQNCEAERYKQELSAFGLMDRGIYVWLEQLARCLIAVPESDLPTRHELLTALKPHIDMYGTLIRLMLHHNVQECVRFRQAHAAQSIYSITEVLVSSDVLATPFDLAHEDHSAMNGFSIMATFNELADILRYSSSRERDCQASNAEVLQVGLEADISSILELMQRFRGAVWRQILLLHVLKNMLKAGGLTIASLWKACQGYEILVALLSSVDLDGGDSPERAFKMMDLVLELLSVTLDLQFDSQYGDNVYTEYFRAIHGYSTVASCIHTSGVMQSAKREMVLQRVFDIISGGDQKHGILNGDAAQIVFRLLPVLPASDAIDAMEKLLSMLESNGEAARLSRNEQAVRLVRAGAFLWIDEPELLAMIRNPEDPLNPVLVKWIVTIALEDDLAISSLQSFLGIVGKAMPMLLCNQQVPSQETVAEEHSNRESPEPGLLMLQSVLRNPAIRHIPVGKPQGDDQTGRYVHVVNSADRVWPPPSGYSFSCWLKFPTLVASDSSNADKARPLAIKARQELVPLCQGFLSLTCGNEEKMDVYGVLAGTTLTLYPSSESAAQKEDAIEELDVRNAYREGPLEWSFHYDARSFVASGIDVDNVDMWWRAVEQCGKSCTAQSGGLLDEGSLPFLGARGDNDTGVQDDVLPESEEGSACIVSIYSLESSGCFVRAFFEQSTGFLHFHTGTVNAGSSINPNPRRTSVVFEAVAIDELRPTGSSSGSEQKRDWHHFAFTHRKAVVGSSVITVYIDGLEVATKKLNYPSASSVGSFQAFVGSDAQVCSPQSALSWNVGSTWLTDEILSSGTIVSIFSLGPAYSHQLSGHAYRSVGDWSEALASLHLGRAADRGIEIAKFAQRLQLSKLGRSCQRQWYIPSAMEKVTQNVANEAINTGAALLAESMMAKKDELTEGLRLAAGGGTPSSRKERNKVAAFRSFISYDCAMNSFGSEIETLLGACKVAEEAVLFTLNTSCGDRSSTSHTQVHYINCAPSNRLDLARSLPSIGGIGQVFFPLLDNATRQCDFYLILKMLVNVLRRNASCLAEIIGSNGYSFLAALICARVHLVDENVLTSVVRLAVAGKLVPYATFNAGTTTQTLLAHPVVVDALALSQVVLNGELRSKLPDHLQCQLVSLLMDLLVPSNPNALFNARQLRRAGLLQWLLTYLTDLGNEECTMDQTTALEMRWCFPKFKEATFEAILQYALSLLRVFLRIESHVDDFNAIAELLLLSMASTVMHTQASPVRVIVLQYLLHEVEHDASNSEGNEVPDRTPKPQRLSDTIVETILYREVAPPAKKRSEKRVDNGNFETASLGSPLADSSPNFGKRFFPGYPVDGFANVLLEIIDQPRENGRWISVEALLAVRILVSLAQSHMAFGEYLLCQPVLMEKLKRVLLKYSTDCCVYIPLLAYVSSIPIEETSYYDPETLSTSKMGSQTVFPPAPQAKKERCVDLVWVLIGELLLQNCRLTSSNIAREVSGIVLGKLAYEVETSVSFFTALCKSSGTIFRIIVQCLLSGGDGDAPSRQASMDSTLQSDILERLTERMGSDASDPSSVADSCVKLTQTIMLRALCGGNEFGSLMILFLEVLDEAISKREESALAGLGAQKCWLALLQFVIEKGEVMTSSTSLVSMKNLCTVCVALSRYLADEENHRLTQAATSELEFDASVACTLAPDVEGPTARTVVCFGVEVLTFLLRCCTECSQPSIAQQLGVEEQQFLYGTLVYCTQTVLLSELDGAHRSMVSSQRILNSLLEAKEMLLQQPNWQSVMMSGLLAQSSTNDTAGSIESSNTAARPPRRMHRVRSLSANVHKEFGIGAESDRSFMLCLASHLYRMLMDDSSEVRHAAIVMWQFMIDRRFEVLKELLIAEPRSSLLQTITSTKKETAVDIFHGGFDRLLYALHRADTQADESTVDTSLNKEIWCQFQLWLAENNALLTDLIITRTETIHRHMLDVLTSCIGVRSSSSANELSLNTDFPARLDVRSTSVSSEIYGGFESNRLDLIVKKAIMKYTSRRDSALESMNDGVAQWRETSLRLANTRNIWQTGRWQIDALSGDDQALASEEEPQRSVFQHKSLGYRLDSTEGPQRMRLRLVRDYSWGDKAKETIQAAPTGHSTDQPIEIDDTSVEAEGILCSGGLPFTKKVEHLENEPFRRSLEFHEVVDVFREFVYQQTVSVDSGESNANMLHNILSRCKMDSPFRTFGCLAGLSTGDLGELTSLSLARTIVNSLLESIENDEKASMGVSPSVLGDISSIIRNAADSPDEHPLPPTLFDAADAEATQYALCLVRHESLRSIRLEVPMVQDNAGAVDRDGSDDGLEEEETPVGVTLLVDGAESEDSDSPGETVLNEEETTLEEEQLGTDENDAIESVPIDEPTSPKPEQVKRFDTSSDAVYGAIARFLRRDDYPPIKSYNAAFIAGMGKTPGLFVICRFGLYFIGGYTKLYNNVCESGEGNALKKPSTEVQSVEDVNPNQVSSQSGKPTNTPTGGRRKATKTLLRAALSDLGVPLSQPKAGSEQFFTVVPLLDLAMGSGEQPAATSSRWSIKYSNVKQFCRIKYQLRPVGIEFFDTFGSTYFLQLETSTEREEIVKLLFQMPLVNSIFWSPVLRTGALVPSVKRIRHAATKRWLRGSMTNFEYLIHLNTLAGRSFNDITQYPVFPWVVADYTSEFLDLDSRDTYRDLSRPMGAIGETRAAQFCERYGAMSQDVDVEDPMGTPAFHYGTHYSCSAYVINYLIRLEPFTALALELQGGVFDHPDRLFRSIPSSWTSASKDNLQDVRELIPEFYYLPEFLYNANNCAFGTTQSGEEVCHVILPPWAHGDPREFVRLNRRALESKYVSEHLHEWIDLVFGCKQTGQAAVDAQNVFMHFTYEGTVDIEQISDPVMRAATLAQIENFGQTPSRLFSSPHPQRKVPSLLSGGAATDTATQSLNPSVGHQYDGMTLSTIEAYVRWHTPLAPALVAIGKDYVFLKKHSVVSVQVTGGAIGDVKLLHDKMQCQGIGCTFMPPRFAKYLDWGSSCGLMKLRVHQPNSGTGRYREANKVLAIIEGAHHSGINCAAVSEDGSLLVTGGQDSVVNLIECSKASDGRRVFKQMAKFVGHSDAVICVAINKELNLIASSSADRSVLLWDLRTRALLQELAGHSTTVIHVSINSANGNILTATSSEIRLWSVNGDLLAACSSSAFGLQAITCALSTRCESWQGGVVAVTGHMNGTIALWGLRYPAELAQQKKDNVDAEVASAKLSPMQSPSVTGAFCSSPSSSRRMELVNTPVSIQSRGTSSGSRLQVVPSSQLFILKLLLDHRTKITALTLGPEQRQLLSGDAEGNCIRWVDDSISPNIH